ncbi:OprD family porin [Pseudomonas paraeruginosa]|uniref:OprD family porin n=1 Tax=Pseudomonas aeruginosa group TaxID=136841 RepID=UPI00071B4931|nr:MULTISPECIES: OprD family porin [Pseudomonas aeruginosa group]KSF75390.1 porin [Pseudomonas aeruginosa]PTC38115.1 putative porin [Pseudomonas aeruginosa]
MSSLILRGAACGLLCAWLSAAGAAGFIEESRLRLQLRNVYFNENFRDEHGMSPRAAANARSERVEWAQGLLFDYQSGYTEGSLGLGIDTLGLLGVHLDSGRGRAGTGLLPVHDDGRAADEFGSLGATLKARLGQTVLRHGTLLPKNPLLIYNDARLLPQTYRGTQLTSSPIDGLSLDVGYLDRFKLRDSSDSTGLYADAHAGRGFGGFAYAGMERSVGERLRLSYFHGQLEHFYRQDFVGMQHDLALAGGLLTTDLRYFRSHDMGAAHAGGIDNDMFSGQLGFRHSGHVFGAGYQWLDGEAGLPYVSGATVYSFSNVGIDKFIGEEEKTWMARYSYDFVAAAVPGLTFMVRYLGGSNGRSGERGEKEWERDAELAYVVQSGPVKGLGVKLRNYVYRSDFSRGRDSNRIYLTYDIALW